MLSVEEQKLKFKLSSTLIIIPVEHWILNQIIVVVDK